MEWDFYRTLLIQIHKHNSIHTYILKCQMMHSNVWIVHKQKIEYFIIIPENVFVWSRFINLDLTIKKLRHEHSMHEVGMFFFSFNTIINTDYVNRQTI